MQPFADVDVLDFTQSLAGPACTQRLATLGANVVKVEPPEGDAFREFADGRIFTAYNLGGKRSLCLDLGTAEGREVAAELAAAADVVVESFRPGVMARFGLDYESVAAANEDVVYCSITGFGQDGPYADDPAYDPVIQAMSGLMSLTGYPDRPPARIGVSPIDCATGANAAFLIAAALFGREMEGSQHIDVALYDTAVSWMGYRVARYAETGEVPPRAGTTVSGVAPNDIFHADGDDPVYVFAPTDRLFRRLCGAIGREDLPDDERFATAESRAENEAELNEELDAAVRAFDGETLHRRLAEAGVPAGPVQTISELVEEDPQVAARDLLVPAYNLQTGEETAAVRLPGRTTEAAFATGDGPPELGEHSRAVLASMGFSDERIRELFEAGTVYGSS